MSQISKKIAQTTLRLIDLLEAVESDLKGDRDHSIETILSANKAKTTIKELETLTGQSFKDFLQNHIYEKKVLAKVPKDH